MEPTWYPGVEPVVINGHMARPGQRRDRLSSDIYRNQPVYYQDENGLLVPATGAGGGRMHRAASVADPRRPAQIVINNEFDNHSPQRSPKNYHHHHHERRISRGREIYEDSYSDDSFEDRAHSSRRHKSHKKHDRPRRSPSRSPSPYEPYNFEFEKMKHELEDMRRRDEEKEREEHARARFEEEKLMEEAKKAKKKKEDEAFRKKAIEEHEEKVKEEKKKEAEKKEKMEEEYKKRVRKDLEKAGLDEDEVEKLLKGKHKEHGHGHSHGHGHGHGHGHDNHHVMDLTRPTYIRVHRRHLSPETLNFYDLPWDWDEVNLSNFKKRFSLV